MIGKTISHYKIIEKLGEGGMSVVYKAEDTKLKRKFLPRDLNRDEESKEWLKSTGRTSIGLEETQILFF